MAVAFWPISLPQVPSARDFTGGPQDARRVFVPNQGAEILAPGFTGQIFERTIRFPQLDQTQFERFQAFVADDLKNGTEMFVWREPRSKSPRWWQIARIGGLLYQDLARRNGRTDISFAAFMLPQVPWFASYIPKGVSRPPVFIADYASATYGLNGVRIAASNLPDIAGTYVVERSTTTAIKTAVETLVAGDIPQSAPTATTRILGFAV